MASLQKHNSYEVKGIKELSNLIISKPTQLRSEHSKTIYNKFHTEILPKIETLDKKEYIKQVKALSKEYRTKTKSHTPNPTIENIEVEDDASDEETPKPSPVKKVKVVKKKLTNPPKSKSPKKSKSSLEEAVQSEDEIQTLVSTIKQYINRRQ